MATLSNPTFYYNQATQTSNPYVGWGGNGSSLTGGNCTRIVRYTLTTGANESASSITIKFFTGSGSGTLKWQEGGSGIEDEMDLTDKMNSDSTCLYFIIGTSATEHIAAGASYVSSGKYTGKVYLDPYYDLSSESSHSLSTIRFHAQLDGEYNISPNSTYYVWIFPGYGYGTYYNLYKWDDGVSSSSFQRQVLLDGVPEGAVYIDTSIPEIANTGPFTTTDSWVANQNTTLSVNGTALKVVSNQSSSTPGAYTILTASVPANDTVILTYTARGNVAMSGRLWSTSAGSAIVYNSFTTLTDSFQTFTITGTASSVIDRLYFFMSSPTTSSWFEIGSIYLTCSTTSWQPYQIYIDNGSSWDLYQAYIDNGSSWDLCN